MDKPEYAANELESERWCPVVGAEIWYSVSTLGRVRRDARGRRTRPGLILRPQRRGKYCHVILHTGDGDSTIQAIHRLVAGAFLPNPENRSQINHIDGDGRNNRLSNLEWSTPRENRVHAIHVLGKKKFARGKEHGSFTHPERVQRGEQKRNSVLTEENVRELRRLSRLGVKTKELSLKFGISFATVYDVVLWKTWKHVT